MLVTLIRGIYKITEITNNNGTVKISLLRRRSRFISERLQATAIHKQPIRQNLSVIDVEFKIPPHLKRVAVYYLVNLNVNF